jgi:hypothetical protein
VSAYPQIPTPSGASYVSEWQFGGCEPTGPRWFRTVEAGLWTVEVFPGLSIDTWLVGTQYEDGAIAMMVSVDGDNIVLAGADEALMLAATLTRAAEEIERMQTEAER